MALLGFTLFYNELSSGVKRQTIRKRRKRPIRLGEKLYLYWKSRTKQCKKIGEAICTETFFVTIQKYEGFRPAIWRLDDSVEGLVVANPMTETEQEELARMDGFGTVLELTDALQKMHGPLNGNEIFQVIRW